MSQNFKKTEMNNNITKADVVQRLLNDKHITATEAVLLLSNNEYELKPRPIAYPFDPWGILSSPDVFNNPYTITSSEKNKNK